MSTDATTSFYGEAPVALSTHDLSDTWTEFMRVLYLPVRIPVSDPGLLSVPSTFDDGVTLPPNLEFMRPAVIEAIADARATATHLADPYVYVSATRGFVSPGNPLNRPGYHTDDFGGTDLNYIWSDVYPTLLLLADDAIDISPLDDVSMSDMEYWAADAQRLADGAEPLPPETADLNIRIVEAQNNVLLRLNPYVVHSAPAVPAPGGMRSFFKISVSTSRYDLRGNSHNHGLDYAWEMFDRQAVRNQPAVSQNVSKPA